MASKTEYKSAIRSRKMIRYALAALILEKEIEKITVKNIVERAEISRGTFYAHYADIFAVFEEIENEIMDNIVAFLQDFTSVDIIQNPMPLLVKVTHFFEQDIEFYRTITNTQCAPTFITKLQDVLIAKILSCDETCQSNDELIYHVHFLVGGLVSLYQDWFAGKFDCSLETLTTTVARTMTKGFQPYTLI
ncbi:TetR/AcrR family transcriptional regulator [Lysinibacillus piscis]|uniref:TetR family transcriptional regulator n=1 Tax=Lysinibacillus piscis TaxID=2518931 RepID=A0ABQ5NLB6_9BACI|nr:TetR/AcrR family transcriptional regulator [Lysinibacillus sp. KH24]GLC89060.1 TetR family transcriptional regulator [Lysinibacillus sp. KH24]